ncbi:non-homologous end-joining factor 1 [Mantella aurantiaca]
MCAKDWLAAGSHMMSVSPDSSLLLQPWKSLQISGFSLLCKIQFTESAYRLIITDLSGVWSEEAGPQLIQERSKDLNKRLKAPVSSFLSRLSRLLLPLLDSGLDGGDVFSCHHTERTLTLTVKSQLSGLPFYWEFHCKEAAVAMVCRHLVRPLVTMTTALDCQNQELCAVLLRKDAEIQDYQESGAMLTRDRLKTEPFDEESFRESFLAENVPELVSSQRPPGFAGRLQRLYSAVTAGGTTQSADAGGVSESPGNGPEPEPQAEESTAPPEEMTATQQSVSSEDQQRTTQVPLADVLSLTQRSQSTISKPKKKKAKGLFT